MQLTENQIDHFFTAILEEIKPRLIGVKLVPKAAPVPVGVRSVTMTKLKSLKGKAMIGRKTEDIPREIGDIERITVPLISHSHGFKLDYQDLEAAKLTGAPLETTIARENGRLIAESVERMIFQGLPKYGVEGIYANAGNTIKVPDGEEWNRRDINVYESVIEMVSKLEETSRYEAKWMLLSPEVYYALMKTSKMDSTFKKLITEAGLFDNGKNIFKAPLPAARDGDPIIPLGCGLIGDYGNNIAERYVQEHHFDSVHGEEEILSDISFQAFDMDKNNVFNFNLETHQGMGIHYNDAFLRLENLMAFPKDKASKTKKTS